MKPRNEDNSVSNKYGAPWLKGDIEVYSDGSKGTDGMAGGGDVLHF